MKKKYVELITRFLELHNFLCCNFTANCFVLINPRDFMLAFLSLIFLFFFCNFSTPPIKHLFSSHAVEKWNRNKKCFQADQITFCLFAIPHDLPILPIFLRNFKLYSSTTQCRLKDQNKQRRNLSCGQSQVGFSVAWNISYSSVARSQHYELQSWSELREDDA